MNYKIMQAIQDTDSPTFPNVGKLQYKNCLLHTSLLKIYVTWLYVNKVMWPVDSWCISIFAKVIESIPKMTLNTSQTILTPCIAERSDCNDDRLLPSLCPTPPYQTKACQTLYECISNRHGHRRAWHVIDM